MRWSAASPPTLAKGYFWIYTFHNLFIFGEESRIQFWLELLDHWVSRADLIITSAIITFIYQAFGSLGPPRGACRSQGLSTNKRPPGACSRFPGEAEAAKKSLGEVNWPRALKTMRQALFECDDVSTRATFFFDWGFALSSQFKDF